MRTILVALTGLIVIHGGAHAATVSGTVFVQLGAYWDSDIRDSVRDLSAQLWAPVYLDTTRTETDSTGAFRFENVPAGRHTLRCEILGTEGASAVIHVDAADIERANLVAKPAEEMLVPRSSTCPRGEPSRSLDYLESLPNPYEPIEREPTWSRSFPEPALLETWPPWKAFTREILHRPEDTLVTLPALGHVLTWCEARDTVWLVVTEGGIHGMDECVTVNVWLRSSADGGKHWDPPLHLGFMMNSWAPDDEIRIAVQEGWLYLWIKHGESPTTPPLSGKLRVPFAVLRRDRDGDGLTDLMEPFFALDPDRADTDGDGLMDKADPNPLVAENLTDETARLVAGIRSQYIDQFPPVIPPPPPIESYLTDTVDVLARETRTIIFLDNCVRALPAGRVWWFCFDDAMCASYNRRIACSDPLPLTPIMWSADSTEAVYHLSGWKSYGSLRRAVKRDGRWISAGDIYQSVEQ